MLLGRTSVLVGLAVAPHKTQNAIGEQKREEHLVDVKEGVL